MHKESGERGIRATTGFFDSNGVPLPGLTAPLVAVAEIIIGIALIVGAATRIAAATAVLILHGALIFVKLPTILGSSETDLAYIDVRDRPATKVSLRA